ncbi:twin-arginine translocase TatA/TatE family subunit [Donghicola tyrosinivorans]|uniref:Sec-independent protein translocase protein TatA n=1 Tax=Donghicola tyrosinivorans TaxID=1652492 RepID=A0A2T0W918_9RHOB|nr:twin-arginine translocase TatA/TatE family subunit [Donghicola tyrosinivorans]PRY83200.1 sec-independent protein translocase protein TatA [Donghicola tyrosinivorans]
MLNTIGLPGLALILLVVVVLFGRGKISSIMGEVGQGLTAFRRGIREGKHGDETSDA